MFSRVYMYIDYASGERLTHVLGPSFHFLWIRDYVATARATIALTNVMHTWSFDVSFYTLSIDVLYTGFIAYRGRDLTAICSRERERQRRLSILTFRFRFDRTTRCEYYRNRRRARTPLPDRCARTEPWRNRRRRTERRTSKWHCSHGSRTPCWRPCRSTAPPLRFCFFFFVLEMKKKRTRGRKSRANAAPRSPFFFFFFFFFISNISYSRVLAHEPFVTGSSCNWVNRCTSARICRVRRTMEKFSAIIPRFSSGNTGRKAYR